MKLRGTASQRTALSLSLCVSAVLGKSVQSELASIPARAASKVRTIPVVCRDRRLSQRAAMRGRDAEKKKNIKKTGGSQKKNRPGKRRRSYRDRARTGRKEVTCTAQAAVVIIIIKRMMKEALRALQLHWVAVCCAAAFFARSSLLARQTPMHQRAPQKTGRQVRSRGRHAVAGSAAGPGKDVADERRYKQ